MAGDLPLFVATAHASQSLRGHVLDAGRAGGPIGHVTSAGVMSREDEEAAAKLTRPCQSGGGNISSRSGGGGAQLEQPGCAVADGTRSHHGGKHGAWSRSVLDLFLLSQCDWVVAAGDSSFPSAVHLLQFQGSYANELGRDQWGYIYSLRTSGQFVQYQKEEPGMLSRFVAMADAIGRLEAAGLGGSGVLSSTSLRSRP